MTTGGAGPERGPDGTGPQRAPNGAESERAFPIVTLSIRSQADVVLVRQRVRSVAELLGYGRVDQTRIATAASEVARAMLQSANGARARVALDPGFPAALLIVAEPQNGAHGEGDASAHLAAELALARRLMDRFEVKGTPEGGHAVAIAKVLPPGQGAINAELARSVADALRKRPAASLLEEVQLQQQELLAVLEDLTARQEALKRLNEELEETNRGVLALYSETAQELEETNRGVMALYAQLDDQARDLQRVNALKDRFMSYLSHEFRTPLNAALAISGLLLDRADGPLTAEQEVQVRFLHDGAAELLEMVNDLLDVAKIEAGRMDLRVEWFSVDDLLSGLRGMFRTLASERGLALVVEDTSDLPPLRTDRGKLSQILRNLISNAVKFTEKGEVRVRAERDAEPGWIRFQVQDTGVGIQPADRERIFQEFVQVAGEAPPGGSGLGLSLSRQLAELLGGSIEVESRPGEGSTFTLRLPMCLPAKGAAEVQEARTRSWREAEGELAEEEGGAEAPADREAPVALVIDDDPASRYLVQHTLAESGCTVVSAATAQSGVELARRQQPDAIFVDLGLPDRAGVEVLQELKADPAMADRPLIVYTSRVLSEDEMRVLGRLALRVVNKADPSLVQTLARIGEALVRALAVSSRGRTGA